MNTAEIRDLAKQISSGETLKTFDARFLLKLLSNEILRLHKHNEYIMTECERLTEYVNKICEDVEKLKSKI